MNHARAKRRACWVVTLSAYLFCQGCGTPAGSLVKIGWQPSQGASGYWIFRNGRPIATAAGTNALVNAYPGDLITLRATNSLQISPTSQPLRIP